MTERWKTAIPGYEVSNLGHVRRTSTRRVLKPQKDAYGSLQIQMKGETFRVARLVGEAFCPAFREHLIPDFKNGDKHDCRASNLLWKTRSEMSVHPYTRNPKR